MMISGGGGGWNKLIRLNSHIVGSKICVKLTCLRPLLLINVNQMTLIFIKCNTGLIWVDPFVPNAPFLYPLKTSENRKVYWEHWERIVHWERMG